MHIAAPPKIATTTLVFWLLLMTGLAISPARAGNPELSAQDEEFLMHAAKGGMAEVKMGRVAAQQAKSPKVKEFAQHMIQDHTASNEELTGLASDLGVTPPQSVGSEHQKMLSQLSELSGAKFDQQYVIGQLKSHREMISIFKQQLEEGKNKELKQFAKDTLPTLQEHLTMAERIHAGS
jgi:putative membrane protein